MLEQKLVLKIIEHNHSFCRWKNMADRGKLTFPRSLNNVSDRPEATSTAPNSQSGSTLHHTGFTEDITKTCRGFMACLS